MPQFVLPKGRRVRALRLAAAVLASLDEAVAWQVTAEPQRNPRSLAQNAYLWAVPYKLIAERTGYEVPEIHEYLLGEYFGWREKRVPRKPGNRKGVEAVPVRTTTADEHGKRAVLNKHEFGEYVEFIQRFAAQKLQLVVPDPDPNYAMWRERDEHVTG